MNPLDSSRSFTQFFGRDKRTVPAPTTRPELPLDTVYFFLAIPWPSAGLTMRRLGAILSELTQENHHADP
jgi:hypothetical protein